VPLFNRLQLYAWRQFSELDIPLDAPCVILTGVNGSGKTTLLNILAKHFGWNVPFISTPLIGRKRAMRLYSDVYTEESFSEAAEIPSGQRKVGEIFYDDETSCQLTVDAFTGANYQLNYQGIQTVTGLYIPSHRPAPVYAQVSTIPTNPVELSQFYQRYFSILSQSMMNAGRYQSPFVTQKEDLIALAVFGESSEHVDANPQYIGKIDEFEEILRIALPKEIGFRSIKVRTPDIVLQTNSGDFALDSMSGGVNALFSILWQVFMFGIGQNRFVVAIDEPENHLHPSMQRMILPNLIKAFPQVQFVVATHSPFVVSSFSDALVVSLQRLSPANAKIRSEVLSGADLSASPNAVLREILKVDAMLPVWVEKKVRELLEATSNLPPDERGQVLMQQLEGMGIGDAIADFDG
jgi:predicted ATPase